MSQQQQTVGDFHIGPAFDGNSALVRRGTQVSTQRPIIVKELDLSSPTTSKHEGRLMAKLNHPHIVKLIDQVQIDHRQLLMMQLAESGDLLARISDAPNGMLAETDAKRLFAQLVLALEHMHANNIVHGDIKPENVFLDANHNVLLGDFGLSTEFDASSKSTVAFAGTLHYAAPEAFLESMVCGPELDVWSAGTVLYVMLRGRYPFWGDSDNDTAKAILMSDAYWPAWFSDDAIDLISKMFVKNPRKRISISQIKRHRFIRDEVRHWSRVINKNAAASIEAPTNNINSIVPALPQPDDIVRDNTTNKKTQSIRMTCCSPRLESTQHQAVRLH
jgi:serine/threonine protein kinase